MKIRHILLTTDLSPESLHPRQAVAELADKHDAKLTFLHVVHELHLVPHGAPMAPPLAPMDVAREVKHAQTILDDQRAGIDDDVEVDTAVVTGERVHDAIVDYAKKNDVDLIAVATHGRTGFRHFALGSVAESVLRHSPIPVLCFPRPDKR